MFANEQRGVAVFMQFEKYLSPIKETTLNNGDTKDIIPKRYTPLTEVSFYILMALQEERHGYEIMQWAHTITDGEVELQGGTLYNSLARLERDGLIHMTREGDRRKYYHITEFGLKVLGIECVRLERIYKNSRDMTWKSKRPNKAG